MTPYLLPGIPLLLTTQLLHAQPALDPLLAPHLAQPRQRSCKRKPFLIARKNAAVLQHCHVHAQIVHQATHCIVQILARIGGIRNLCLLLGSVEGVGHFVSGEEELCEWDLGCEDEFGLESH